MNFISHSSVGTTKVHYYSGDATPYINFTNTVINNAGVGDLGNVNINNAQNDEVLKYDSATQAWVNGPVEVDEIDLSDIADVDITTPTNGQVLTYDASSDTWINSSISMVYDLSDLSDVTVSSPTSGQILKYNGSVWVNSAESTGATTLDELTDVTLTTPANGQVLKYDGSKWVNGADSTVSDLDDLSDVSIATPTSGQILKYNGSTWVNGAETIGATDLDELTDVTLTSPTAGQVLKYDGSKWINDAGGSSVSDLDDLSDVTITSPTDGQALIYDSNSGNWVNGAGGSVVGDLDDLSDVDITTPTDGQALIYDAANDKWVNGSGGGSSTLSGLTDVTITSPSNDQVLKYDSNSGTWVNGTGGGGGASALNDLTDVAITSAANNDSLVYNSTNSEWENKQLSVSLTQAEYDALQTIDPNITYYITDTNGNNDQFQPIIYSEEEREIGVWTNGKPLYEKSLSPNVTSSSFTVDISSLSVDTMVSIEGNIPQTSGNIVIIPYFTASNDYALCYYNNNYLKFAYAGVYNSTTWRLKIRYTKTTDTAGSGTWTPQGVPAVHYSTSEQIVGTWIDGSTLYEKTIDFGEDISISSSGWTTTSATVTNIGAFINCYGHHSDGSFQGSMLAYANGNALQLQATRNGSTYVRYVTLRYTKSS